jgi:hypothetical protein
MLGEDYESIRKNSYNNRMFLQKNLLKGLVLQNYINNKFKKEN